METSQFLQRTKHRDDSTLRVTVAVPSREESTQVFDRNLARKNIQPVWVQVGASRPCRSSLSCTGGIRQKAPSALDRRTDGLSVGLELAGSPVFKWFWRDGREDTRGASVHCV